MAVITQEAMIDTDFYATLKYSGAGGDTAIVDASALSGHSAGGTVTIKKVKIYGPSGIQILLEEDLSSGTQPKLLYLNGGQVYGGSPGADRWEPPIKMSKATNYTGDVDITSSGTGNFTLIIQVTKDWA
jgi:hypothetical protein